MARRYPEPTRPSDWEHVAPAWSRSDPDTRYEIKRRRGTEQYGCSCPAWRFKRERQVGPTGEETQTCKHIRRYFEQLAAAPVAAVGYPLEVRAATLAPTPARLESLLLECAPELSTPRRRLVALELSQRLGLTDGPAMTTFPLDRHVVREVVLED